MTPADKVEVAEYAVQRMLWNALVVVFVITLYGVIRTTVCV